MEKPSEGEFKSRGRNKGNRRSGNKEHYDSKKFSHGEKPQDTKSFRIYGNPNGEGFLMEEQMVRSNEDGHERKKKDGRESIKYTEFNLGKVKTRSKKT